MRPVPAIVACAALLAAALARDAAAIVRCEDAAGRVTYANTECPPNTRLVRKVEPSPPVIVHDKARPAAKAGAAPPPARAEPTGNRRTADPIQEDQELTAQLAEQRRECEARAREIQRLQDDVSAAPADARASAELTLRRAQDDYKALCPRPR